MRACTTSGAAFRTAATTWWTSRTSSPISTRTKTTRRTTTSCTRTRCWLPVPSRKVLGTATQAADVCAEMLGLQGTALDSAMIYDARCGLGIFSPLFNPYDYSPHKAYYAFKAFNELYKRGTEVESSSSDRWVTWVAAARGEKDGAVVIAHTGDKEVPLVLELCGRAGSRPSPRGSGVKCKVRECRITDETRTNEIIPLPSALPPHSFLIVTIERCRGN